MALQDLSRNTQIVIKEADKGGAIVAININDYRQEIMRQLNNGWHYKSIEKDPTTHIMGSFKLWLMKQCLLDFLVLMKKKNV